jgi:hypothetical protein
MLDRSHYLFAYQISQIWPVMIDFSSKNRSFFIKKRPFLGQFFIEKHSQFSSKIDQNGFELCRLKFSTYLHSKFIKFGCFWSIFVQKIDFEIFVRRHRLRTTREKTFFFFFSCEAIGFAPFVKNCLPKLFLGLEIIDLAWFLSNT